MGDEHLAARAAAGNQAAFTTLCERYHGPLLGYCRSILLNVEDAQDATQTALESALRSLPRREPQRPLKPWLYRIAHNESINIVRRRQPRADADPAQELTVPGPEVDAEQRARLAQLVDDLRLLPERQRGALVMRELSGLSYDDIGLALDISNEAARRAVFDARTALHAAAAGRATACVNVRRSLSDGDRRSLRARGIRAHLRSCRDCTSFEHAIVARRADLPALAPWLPGATALGLLGLGAGGAGGGTLVTAGGGTSAALGGGLGWTGLPVTVKGFAVAAVVATGGTAAVEMKRVAMPNDRAPAAQPKVAKAVGSSPALAALGQRAREAAAAAAAGARRARRGSLRATSARVGSRVGGGASSATSGHGVARLSTAGAERVARTPGGATGAPARPHPTSIGAPVAAPQDSAAQLAIENLGVIRERIKSAFQQAQQTAAPGTYGALQSAGATLQNTLHALGPVIDRILATVGLSLPATPAAPPAPPPSPSAQSEPSLPDVLAPAQQILGGVTALLEQLVGQR